MVRCRGRTLEEQNTFGRSREQSLRSRNFFTRPRERFIRCQIRRLRQQNKFSRDGSICSASRYVSCAHIAIGIGPSSLVFEIGSNRSAACSNPSADGSRCSAHFFFSPLPVTRHPMTEHFSPLLARPPPVPEPNCSQADRSLTVADRSVPVAEQSVTVVEQLATVAKFFSREQIGPCR